MRATLAVVAFAGVVGLAGLAACRRGDKGGDKADDPADNPPVQVTCAPARAAVLGDRIVLRGVVKPPPDRDALVAAAVPGRVAEVKVQEGDVVAPGQLIAVVDDPALASTEIETQAAVGSASAAAAAARQAQVRAQKLFDEGVAPRRDVEEGTAKLAAAEAELKAARARAGLAATQRDRAQVKASRAGTIVKVLRRPGELVDGTAATAIVELADVTELELAAEAPAADLVHLTEKMNAEVHLDAVPDVTFPGVVVRVAPGVDATTALGGVRVHLGPIAAARPRLGLAGRAEIQLAGRPVVLVPAAALRRSVDGTDQVVVCADAKAAIRAVTVGARTGDEIDVVKGLAPGERVVVDHALGLEDGAALAPRGGRDQDDAAHDGGS